MQDTQNTISPQLWANIETKQGIETEIQKFRFKSFYERHKAAAAAVGAAGTAFMGLLSIGCAVMFLAEKLAAAIPFYAVAVIVAVVILGALELLKTYTLSNLFESFYYEKLHHGTGKISGSLAVGAVILIGLSAALSILGADYFIMQSADKSKEITLQGFAKVDSARAVFDAKILALESTIKEIESGKVDRWGKMLTPSENKQILNLQARIAETETAKNAAVSEQKDGTQSAISETKESAMSSATIGGLIATFNEAGIVLCVWFVWFFAFKVANESKLIGKELGMKQANGGTVQSNEVIIETETATAGGTLPNGEKKGIGFNFGQKVANEPLAQKPAVPVNEALKNKPINEPLHNEPLHNEPLKNGVLSPPVGTIIIGKDYGNPPRKCKCGQWFHWKLAHKESCTKDCQIGNWEAKTGKKFVAGKKR